MLGIGSVERLSGSAAVMFACGVLLMGCGPQPPGGDGAAGTASSPVERGKYLVTILGCNECHTPHQMGPTGPQPDMSRMLSGHPESMQLPPPPAPIGPWMWAGVGTLTAFVGPWGTTYAANLTPDQNTGLGIWTEEMFVNAMRQGKHMGTSREIQPPMPWQWYGQMTDADLKAIYAYLRTIPSIVNHVPEYEPPGGQGGN